MSKLLFGVLANGQKPATRTDVAFYAFLIMGVLASTDRGRSLAFGCAAAVFVLDLVFCLWAARKKSRDNVDHHSVG